MTQEVWNFWNRMERTGRRIEEPFEQYRGHAQHFQVNHVSCNYFGKEDKDM